MEGKSTREELGILLKDIKETFCLKNLFGPHLHGTSYHLSPHIHFFAIKLPFQYSVLRKIYWSMIYFNSVYIITEQIWSLSLGISTQLKIHYIMFRYLFLYGVISAAILMTNRQRIIAENRKLKALQWSLHCIDPKVKAAIGKRGLILSLISEFCLLLLMLYITVSAKELRHTFFISAVKRLHQPFLEDFLYFFEYLNFAFCVFFAAIVPQLCIYFATEAEVQTRLLSAYVSRLTHKYNSSSMEQDQSLYHRKVYLHLAIIHSRHLELKRFYTDNKALITSVGLKYIIPGIFSFTCNAFEYVQNNINLLMCGMNALFVVVFSVHTLYCGQTYEDEWKNYYREICKLPWYIWTVDNRKIYLLILMGSSRTTKIRIINNISVNYNLLVQIFKYFYASANAARNIYKKKVGPRSSIS
ncbi:uncharacterized protein [Euwallacea fornicatus]|uniref:uncharacterized protein n=1 Tax=Euwallacea fornicatus TaxID=995702 RepID=UPI0033904EAD